MRIINTNGGFTVMNTEFEFNKSRFLLLDLAIGFGITIKYGLQ